MAAFRPWFERVDVIVLNYNGLPWPEKVQQAFEKSIEEGKGLVVIHAADNAFPTWANYDRMIGLGWRPKGAGARISFDDSGISTARKPAKAPTVVTASGTRTRSGCANPITRS